MRLRFGQCVLDIGARELRRAGVTQELSPKAFQFLELLLACRPRAVARSVIHERLWPDAFVSDSSLARLACELRAAIGDDARHSQLVRTVHRHGYAFSGTVADEPPDAARRPAACRLLWDEREIPVAELEAPAELADGDEIGVGPAVLLFRTAHGDSTTETGTGR